MSKIAIIAAGLFLCAATHRAAAQGAIRQSESVEQRRALQESTKKYTGGESAPELYPGETTDVGPQTVLKLAPRKTYFEGIADAQYFRTDNMFLAHDHKDSADVLVSTVQVALAPTAYDLGGGTFAPRIGYRHQWFNYGLISDKKIQAFDFETGMFKQVKLHEFDFNVQTAFIDGRWTRDNWVFDAGFNFRRLLTWPGFDEFYREYVPRWGVQRIFPLDENKAFTIGYEGDYRFTDTARPLPSFTDDFNDRTDHSLFVAYSQSLCRSAAIQPYYHFQYTRFTQGESRNDYLHSFGVALYCSITPQLGVRAFVGYDILDTNSGIAPDYRKLDAGGGLNLTLRF
ncbi:MAG TPA: hypothetical protein VMZ27_11475 [Candidatus Saccharimonadales bacterium]|nr:hypothetical protein [Candidatus Saccharimonadales bacterium]